MTHFLRINGKTIVDVEATKDDISSVVCIGEYSRLLLSVENSRDDVIRDFDDLQELRGEWHEVIKRAKNPDEFARERLLEIAQRYNLQYVTD